MQIDKPETPEIYTLNLMTTTSATKDNSYIYPIENSNLSNVTWLVDFDNLFKGRQQYFKYCRTRYYLQSLNNTAGYTWNDNLGYISVNLATDFNAETTNGTILGLIYARSSQMTGFVSPVYSVDAKNDIGVDINISQLTGIQTFNIKIVEANGDLVAFGTNNYTIELTFEFYN